jgi:hypothetical protein
MDRRSPQEVGDLIHAKIEAFGENAWFINNGWCWGFAIAKILGPEAKVVGSSSHYQDGTFPGHSWVEYDGLHYDAETPEGVEDPRQMQYHRRLRAIVDSPEDKTEEDSVLEALGHEPVYYGPRL